MDSLQNQVNQNIPMPGNISDDSGVSFPQDIPVASPSDFFPPAAPASTSKKFAGGRIIAAFLGMLLLVGGIGAGIVLVQNPQLLGQKAYDAKPTPIPYCRTDVECSDTEMLRSIGCIGASGNITYCCPQNYKIFPEEHRCILK